jgi:regulator of replication initiation timing
MTKLSDAQEQLISDFYNLKKDFAIKLEEIQALYLECKNHSKTIDKLTLENKHLKQQIKHCLEKEAEEMLLYP